MSWSCTDRAQSEFAQLILLVAQLLLPSRQKFNSRHCLNICLLCTHTHTHKCMGNGLVRNPKQFFFEKNCLCNFMLCLLLLVQFATSRSGSSVRARAHERPCFDFRRATMPLVPKHSHHRCLLFQLCLAPKTSFQIPSKSFQAKLDHFASFYTKI